MTTSKRTLSAIAVAVVAVVVGAYFAFFSTKSSSVTFKLEGTSLASNAQQVVTGSVSPAEKGRVVIVEAKPPSGGWAEVQRVPTNEVGTFKATFPMTTIGKWDVRVSVDSKGRQGSASAGAQTVSVLNPTQLEAEVGKYARSDKTFRIAGRVTPAGSRTVNVEASTDGTSFAPVGHAPTNPQTGQFAVYVPGLKPGSMTLRVTVDASSEAAAAQGEPQAVKVEDYVSAGKRYLAIVKRVNDLYAADDKLYGTYAMGPIRKSAAAISQALTRQARLLRAYAYWPQEVKGYIETIVKSDIIDADYWNRLAHAKTVSEYNATSPAADPKGADTAPALARAALGLPKRK